uniref:uncharacterized protein LOC120821434 n=1 Tax=Gasterosteus aculeatus aculeatus TaxID=481459 RepID=UPI001A9A0E89|nr:uncharacterized protein LOC120821434 [Gasterosteus aculeatus aculeatus]
MVIPLWVSNYITFVKIRSLFQSIPSSSGPSRRPVGGTRARSSPPPRLRLHLAAYEDTMGLERFLHLTIRTDRRMQPCLEDLEGQPSPSPPRQPELTSSPEPVPMQLDNTCLSYTERQRRLTQGLCLYCGDDRHIIIFACPICSPRHMYTPSSTLGQLGTSSPSPSAASSISRRGPTRSIIKSTR